MVDDKVDWCQGVDLLRVAAEASDTIAHRRQVDHRRNAGKVLHQHPGRAIGDLARVLAALRPPFGKGADVIQRHGAPVLESQHVFQHHLQRCGQPGEIAETGSLCRRDRIVGDRLAPCGQHQACFGAVMSNKYGHAKVSLCLEEWGCSCALKRFRFTRNWTSMPLALLERDFRSLCFCQT